MNNLPFTGEMMTCVICGAEKQSDPGDESNWRCIQIGDKRYYACPDEFPPDGKGSILAYEYAYKIIFHKSNLLYLKDECEMLEQKLANGQKVFLVDSFNKLIGEKYRRGVVRFSVRTGWTLCDGWRNEIARKEAELCESSKPSPAQ